MGKYGIHQPASLVLLAWTLAGWLPVVLGDGGCPPITKELLSQYAKDNLVMIMAVDKLLAAKFAATWVSSVQQAGITYWMIGALDPHTSMALAAMGIQQCFNAPMGAITTDQTYRWGSHHWHETTWKKVAVAQLVYNLGFHVFHADADATWFNDPLPWLKPHMSHTGPPHALFSTDSLETHNAAGDLGLEAETNPFVNINTGIYFIKQWPEGRGFLEVWRALQQQHVGHDQDGLNTLVRGRHWHGKEGLPEPLWGADAPVPRTILCALHNTTAVGLLPVHMWGNAYTYGVGRVHERLNAKLMVVHWVWSGGNEHCKLQRMRDALKYVDLPEHYGLPPAPVPPAVAALTGMAAGRGAAAPAPLVLLSMDLDTPQMPAGYNELKLEDTEKMVQFHVAAGTQQLQQAYWGIVAAAVLNRTFVLPAFDCYCAKNWYMTQACRINGERHTQFPYKCALADLLRASKTLAGMHLPVSLSHTAEVHVREWPFLSHPRVPDEIKRSKLVLRPKRGAATLPVADGLLKQLKPQVQPDGSAVLEVPWPLNTDQLQQVVQAVPGPWRIVHLANASRILGAGFANAAVWHAFDEHIAKYQTYWCCRSPADQERLQLGPRETLHIIPRERQHQQSSSPSPGLGHEHATPV